MQNWMPRPQNTGLHTTWRQKKKRNVFALDLNQGVAITLQLLQGSTTGNAEAGGVQKAKWYPKSQQNSSEISREIKGPGMFPNSHGNKKSHWVADGKTHRWSVCWQEEYKHNEHANAAKGDKLLGTMSRVHDQPRHQQAQSSQNEKPGWRKSWSKSSLSSHCEQLHGRSAAKTCISLTIWSIYNGAWRLGRQVGTLGWLFRPSAHSPLHRTQRQRPNTLGPQVRGPSGNPVHRLQWSTPHNLQSTRESVSSKNPSLNPSTCCSWDINTVGRRRNGLQLIVTVKHTLTDA